MFKFKIGLVHFAVGSIDIRRYTWINVDFVCMSWNQIINYLLPFHSVIGNNFTMEI